MVSESIVQRLRTSKQSSDAADRERGWKAGEEWAREFAEACELGRLERHGLGNGATIRDADEFAELVQSDVESIFDDDEELTPAYVNGFAEGAVQVWLEAKDLI